jgi:cathepsin B
MLTHLLLIILAISLKSVYEMSIEEFKTMLCDNTHEEEMLLKENIKHVDHRNDPGFKNIYIPTNFDIRTKYGSCIHPIRNQGACGSCWAHTTSEVMSDRFCISSGGAINVVLAPQYLVSCDTYDSGCEGGFGPTSFKFVLETGIVTEACCPYKAVDSTCPTTCTDGTAITSANLYKCAPNSVYQANDADSIKIELMQNGPMYCRFDVYTDFKEYKSGIYYVTSKSFLGGHAVKLLGWGRENGIEFWVLQNSWGDGWGENGNFRIKVGAGGICSFAVGCKPQIN